MTLTPSDVDDANALLQEAFKSNLNQLILYGLLIGLYTALYLGTLRLYLTRRTKGSQRSIVITAITVMYLLCVTNFVTRWVVEVNGFRLAAGVLPTRVIILHSYDYLDIIAGFSATCVVFISDGLLVWRCFHVWDRSWLVISFPLLLTLSEIAMAVRWSSRAGDSLNFYNLIVSTSATLITTALIGYRVYMASRLTGIKSKKRFRRVFHLVLESSMVYSLVMICAVVFFNPEKTSPGSATSLDISVQNYLAVLIPIAAGMAPTILVARIVTVGSNDTQTGTITHISGLVFQSGHGGGSNADGISGDAEIRNVP